MGLIGRPNDIRPDWPNLALHGTLPMLHMVLRTIGVRVARWALLTVWCNAKREACLHHRKAAAPKLA